MKNIWIMAWYTLREAMARKVFVFFAGISFIVLVLMAVVFSFTNTSIVMSSLNVTGDAVSMGKFITSLEMLIVSPLSGLCLLLAIFASSSFIPIMLEKGNIDLLLSKPISRSQLLWGKYLGGLLVVFLNIAFLIAGVWLIISLKFSYWNISFLSLALIITFTFAVLYSLIVLLGVITKSSMFGMMVAYFIFLILSPILAASQGKLGAFIESDFLKTVIKGLYYIVPKTHELMGEIAGSLSSGQGIENYQPIISSIIFLIVTMWMSVIIFKKKDF